MHGETLKKIVTLFMDRSSQKLLKEFQLN